MQQPPKCPHCPDHPLLWKDTTQTTVDHPHGWRWWCSGCESRWAPTSEQRLRYA